MKLLHDNVLIQPQKNPEKNDNGIYLSANALKELPPFGRVMAIGKDIKDIKVNDRVIYSVYSGMEVDSESVIVPYKGILAVYDGS